MREWLLWYCDLLLRAQFLTAAWWLGMRWERRRWVGYFWRPGKRAEDPEILPISGRRR
jgi:hypothetical protein